MINTVSVKKHKIKAREYQVIVNVQTYENVTLAFRYQVDKVGESWQYYNKSDDVIVNFGKTLKKVLVLIEREVMEKLENLDLYKKNINSNIELFRFVKDLRSIKSNHSIATNGYSVHRQGNKVIFFVDSNNQDLYNFIRSFPSKFLYSYTSTDTLYGSVRRQHSKITQRLELVEV